MQPSKDWPVYSCQTGTIASDVSFVGSGGVTLNTLVVNFISDKLYKCWDSMLNSRSKMTALAYRLLA